MRKFFHICILGLVALAVQSCFKKEDYDHVDSASLIKFKLHNQSQFADGNSSVNIQVIVDSKVAPAKRVVVLKTSLGSFISGKGDSIVVKADDNLLVSADLVSAKDGAATITAYISNYAITDLTPVTFKPAYPVKITASVDSFSIKNSFKSEVVITASLKSDKGVPTQGQVVTFSALSPTGTPIGAFINGINTAQSNASGIATIRFSAGQTSTTGKLTISAQVNKEDGTPISGITYIYLTN
jgi:hypothetical protein